MLKVIDHDKRFYDTCSLLIGGRHIFEKHEPFLISSITLQELEKIKVSSRKDADIKYSARILLHLLEKYQNLCQVVIHDVANELAIEGKGLDITPDTKILSDAIAIDKKHDIVFVTNDLSLKHIANLFFGDGMIESVPESSDKYTGYREVLANDERLALFYQDLSQNIFQLNIGQYIIIRGEEENIKDVRVWTGETHRYLKYSNFNSKQFGKVIPYKDDIYQKLVFDSLTNNQLTVIRGKPGSGKSYCALAYLFQKLEKYEIDRIIIFCNPVATADSAKLGFYPGDKQTKLLDSQIGNFLASKLGDRMYVEKLLAEEKLVLVPTSDCRGMEIPPRSGVYITEAQNTTIDIMQLMVQRVGEGCICIIEGDDRTQVDMKVYEGNNNGLARLSEVFRGEDYYGEVMLQNCYRSKIAKKAEEMRVVY